MTTSREWPTLLIIDTPDGERTVLLCRTSARLQSNEGVIVFESTTGWSTHGEDQSKRPYPEGHYLRLRGSATVKNEWAEMIPDVPWVVYVEAVPR